MEAGLIEEGRNDGNSRKRKGDDGTGHETDANSSESRSEPSSLPAKHYDPATTEPISSSLSTLEELLSWKRSEASLFNVASVPVAKREPPLSSCQKRTLVCHDMMGGYLEDRFIQGAVVTSPYALYHWQCVDIFTYFSHNMVTIPPAMWTNAAHKHGVLCLGTFITEWTVGREVCEKFLAGEEAYRAVADKLVQIAHAYGFDGWLINIENSLSATAVKNTALFLRYLTDQMKERVPGGLIIWYDSVLEDGSLKWQNELNDHNKVFFESCDGIFTNYNWTEANLEKMTGNAAAQGRLADIFVGIDVFARGEVVGGGFECNKALNLIRKHGLSAAIFAPGWVYECHDKEQFRNNQDKFWELMSDHLIIRRPSFSLPFVSSFCQGFGKSLYWKGQVEREKSWLNLSAQEVQPLYGHQSVEGKGWLRTRGCPEDVWSGGTSLVIEGMIPSTLTSVCARIFSFHMPLAENTFVSFVYKPSAGVSISLELKTMHSAQCVHAGTREIYSSVQPTALGLNHKLVKEFTRSCGQWESEGWTTRCFQLEVPGCALREICINVSRDGTDKDLPFSVRVGEIMVLDAESLRVTPVSIAGVAVFDVVWQRGVGGAGQVHLSATLHWSYPAQRTRHFRIHWRRLRGPDPRTPPGPLTLIGRSYSTLFRVVELPVPDGPGLLELVVEPVTREGFSVPESHWGRCPLSYTKETAQGTV
ncbi:cytosolic endo-beta-N-acetylglucosaminidase [Chanos chanos]|uniref:Cytosolic endo-beta-N-acetylglucosaminidase n=1 Tax=Chanos chanos TaxID=29144 RepID=A0A6J2WMZ0_CHACN|nr:cytosolic endo-beta-N-acetylglucosaminidase [Chanos chanos]